LLKLTTLHFFHNKKYLIRLPTPVFRPGVLPLLCHNWPFLWFNNAKLQKKNGNFQIFRQKNAKKMTKGVMVMGLCHWWLQRYTNF
jgi:hypothetical protein